MEELARLASIQPPSKREVIFRGEPIHLYSGKVEAVGVPYLDPRPLKELPFSGDVRYERTQYLPLVLSCRLGESQRLNFGGVIAWVYKFSDENGFTAVSWPKESGLPKVGDVFFVEELPKVVGSSFEPTRRGPHVVFENLWFP